jgi:uncharacterized protein
MKFTRETRSAVTVRHVERGAITVGDTTVTETVVLFRDAIDTGWPSTDPATASEADFAELIDAAPEIILFGTGWSPAIPPRELIFAMARKGIGFEFMDTPAACRTFNILVGEDRDVAAVLLLD